MANEHAGTHPKENAPLPARRRPDFDLMDPARARDAKAFFEQKIEESKRATPRGNGQP